MCQCDTGIVSIDKLFGQLSIAGQYGKLSIHFGSIAILVWYLYATIIFDNLEWPLQLQFLYSLATVNKI